MNRLAKGGSICFIYLIPAKNLGYGIYRLHSGFWILTPDFLGTTKPLAKAADSLLYSYLTRASSPIFIGLYTARKLISTTIKNDGIMKDH